jgi:hypothetical protein
MRLEEAVLKGRARSYECGESVRVRGATSATQEPEDACAYSVLCNQESPVLSNSPVSPGRLTRPLTD